MVNNYKVVLLGEGRVGKTSILLRYSENSYVEGRPSTLQASYIEKHIVITDEHIRSDFERSSSLQSRRGRREALLYIWDTAGQERYHSLAPLYYRNANGAILVYDITDRDSFERVRKWAKELRKMLEDFSKVCIIIVGNKLDLERHRVVGVEEADNYAKSVGADYIEVSAKTGSGVEDVFLKISSAMLDTIEQTTQSKSNLANGTEMIGRPENVSLLTINGVTLATEQQCTDSKSKCC